MKTLYLISGPSGSGKTTFASKIKEEKEVEFNFEADHWMMNRHGEYCFESKRLGYCHHQCQEHTENIMKSGKDVIVSNTSLTVKEAKPYINLAKKYQYKIEIHHMTGQFENVHNVPDWKVEEMRLSHQLYSLEDFN